MTKLSGKILITGASSGIGAAYADRLARRGHELILVARNEARLEELASSLSRDTGRTPEVLVADLADRAQLAAVKNRLAGDASIGALINNAGVSLSGTVLDADLPAIENLLAVNVLAPTLLARAAANAFRGRGAGTIVTISSVLALIPERFDPAYSATKAFLLNLCQGLAQQLSGSGVHVQAVLPGMTRTEIWERSGKSVESFPAEMVMEVGDLVDAALVGLDRGETVTIPPLADEAPWQDLQAARMRLAPQLSRREVGARYFTGG